MVLQCSFSNLFEPIDHPLSNVGEQTWSILAPKHLEMKEIMTEIQSNQIQANYYLDMKEMMTEMQIAIKLQFITLSLIQARKNANTEQIQVQNQMEIQTQIQIQIGNIHLRSDPGKDKGGRVKHPLVCLAV